MDKNEKSVKVVDFLIKIRYDLTKYNGVLLIKQSVFFCFLRQMLYLKREKRVNK